MRRLLPVVVLLSLLIAAAGCSTSKPGEKVVTPTPTKVVGTVPKAAPTASVPAQYKNGDPVAGKTIFKTGPCAGCHTLADAGTHGTVGPNLDQTKPSLEKVIDRVTHGKSPMPAFGDQNTLTKQQIADVAAYVVQATSG